MLEEADYLVRSYLHYKLDVCLNLLQNLLQ